MKRSRIYFAATIVSLLMLLISCDFSEDAEDLQIHKLPDIENTDGNDGGTGGETPPPGG